MNSPSPPQDPAEVARQQQRQEQMMLESRLELLRVTRQQRESKVNRWWSFFLVFGSAAFVTYALDHKGYKPEVSLAGCVGTIVVVGAWWAYRKPYGS